VVSMSPEGWEPFQSKDFGFRSDSALTESKLRTMADDFGLPPPVDCLTEASRRSLAIDLELQQIRQRVMAVLEGQMSMGPDLAEHWTSATNSRQIGEWAERLSADAVRAEFGLVIHIRGFRRLDSDTDTTERTKRVAHHKVIRETADRDAAYALEYERQEREVLDKNRLGALASLGHREREALEDPSSPEGEEVARRVREELASDERRPRLSSERSSLALSTKPAASVQKELPWLPTSTTASQDGTAQDRPAGSV